MACLAPQPQHPESQHGESYRVTQPVYGTPNKPIRSAVRGPQQQTGQHVGHSIAGDDASVSKELSQLALAMHVDARLDGLAHEMSALAARLENLEVGMAGLLAGRRAAAEVVSGAPAHSVAVMAALRPQRRAVTEWARDALGEALSSYNDLRQLQPAAAVPAVFEGRQWVGWPSAALSSAAAMHAAATSGAGNLADTAALFPGSHFNGSAKGLETSTTASLSKLHETTGRLEQLEEQLALVVSWLLVGAVPPAPAADTSALQPAHWHAAAALSRDCGVQQARGAIENQMAPRRYISSIGRAHEAPKNPAEPLASPADLLRGTLSEPPSRIETALSPGRDVSAAVYQPLQPLGFRH
eukprot:TRINITY_DN12067_c0_g1_i1.p1 TRINITY_DN12067_c0_g1~~TRINITY_DN12067_c0_g1_i1.p1  ORF type:complete len:355 (+),score=69.06 TRINITY_DN12067_c0_g1_i1:66-1130(+)